MIEADACMRDKYGNNYSLSDITASDENAYKGYIVETYYRIVNDAMKRYDPNYLFLGTRIHSSGRQNAARIFSYRTHQALAIIFNGLLIKN